jgi:gas vesicle protein
VIPPETSISELFDQASGALLILGEPGSGKTTLLLELCRQEIERAQVDPLRPIPVVFNLSSWWPEAGKTPAQYLSDWLLSELRRRYAVPDKISRSWMEKDAILLLLDGLDEVPETHRAACVQAINAFRQDHALPLVVCSRRQEYEALGALVNLNAAVLIQPLSDEQLRSILRADAAEFKPLANALQRDAELRQLAQTPLWLSILTQAFRQAGDEAIQIPKGKQNIRQFLFDRYITQMFARRSADQRYTPDQTIQWLSWLAQNLTSRGHTTFSIEDIRPRSLPAAEKKLNRIARLCIMLLLGLGIGSLGWFIDWMVGSWGTYTAIGFGLGLGAGALLKLKIHTPTDKLVWHWSAARNGAVLGLVLGFGVGVLTEIGSGWQRALLNGLADSLAFAWVMGLFFGMNRTSVTERNQPGDGIRASVRSMLASGSAVGLSCALIFGVMGGLAGGLRIGVVVGALIGLSAGLIVALANGGEYLLKHLTTRVHIVRNGYLPWNLADFFDHSTERIFLRQVGGGYMFIHRMLMEHFAGLAKIL